MIYLLGHKSWSPGLAWRASFIQEALRGRICSLAFFWFLEVACISCFLAPSLIFQVSSMATPNIALPLSLLPFSREDSYIDILPPWPLDDALSSQDPCSHLQSPLCTVRSCIHRFQVLACGILGRQIILLITNGHSSIQNFVFGSIKMGQWLKKTGKGKVTNSSPDVAYICESDPGSSAQRKGLEDGLVV